MSTSTESNFNDQWEIYPLLQVLLETMDLSSIHLVIDLSSLIHNDVPNRHQLITNLINNRRKSNNLPLYDVSDIKTIIYLFKSCDKLSKMFIPELSAVEQIFAYNAKCTTRERITTNYVTSFTNTCISCYRPLVCGKIRTITCFKQTGVESALLFEYRCPSVDCGLIYCANYYRHPATDRITITPTSISHSDIIYLGGDFAYEKDLLFEFTSALIFNYVSFYGFAKAYNYRNSLKNKNTALDLAQLQDKHFQAVWIQYQLACFFFMTSKNKNFECLSNFATMSENRDRFLRQQNRLMEPLFMILWTNHKQIAKEEHIFKYDKKSKQKINKCSTCMVADGHEKASRLICGYKSSVSIRHDELGPLEIGCAETPLRRTSGNVKDAMFCRKHQPCISTDVQVNADVGIDMDDQEIIANGSHRLPASHSIVYDDISNEQADLFQPIPVTKRSDGHVNTNLQRRKAAEVDEQIKSVLGLDVQVDVASDVCNVYRESLLEQKNSSSGFTAIFYDCGIIVAFQESIRSESVRRLLFLLLTLVKTVNNKVPNALLYDNACSLRLFIDKWYNNQFFKLSEYSTFIKNMHIAIDRFHQDNHRRTICKTIMRADDPSHAQRFDNVNSEICEQMFSYFVKFKSAFRNYNYPKSFTFYLLLFHLKNCQMIALHPCTQSIDIDDLNNYWEKNSHPTKRSLENNDFSSKKRR